MDAHDIRDAYLRFFTDRGHRVIPRAPLVPRDDPTTLFNGSGMQQLVPYLLGRAHPLGSRLTDSQPCLRAQDIAEVGDNRHTTFFEMLGNWSLGDYFKSEQIPWFWEFLTGVVGLDPARIYVSCFAGDPEHAIPRDTESAGIWAELFDAAGIDSDAVDLDTDERAAAVGTGGARIAFYGPDNWWCRMGSADAMPVGEPGGPDSEVFYLYPQVEHDPAYGEHCHHNCDCGRFIELGNSVFMQYSRTESGFAELPRRNVDYGGGLERIAAAAVDSPDVFRISLLWPIVEKLEQLSGARYDTHTKALRVVADHLRGATFLAIEGVRPGNKEQGYVMRRLVRRAIRYAQGLGLEESFLAEIVPTVAGVYQDRYPEVAAHRDEAIEVLAKEERSFRRTVRRGIALLDSLGTHVDGHDLFTLHDTYGFPVELSLEEAHQRGTDVSAEWRVEFDADMAAQRERSRAGR
ncbi:hypothetical protein G4H71_09535 [Rhodococcus triatomae]|uniref:alanine--tRNA ligase n=1 Tax=Rhodococcus triatomae TaxID=300028 RepID=A0A1G8HPI9_9NOCA|nr:alanine--tRNA ligase-related protein [Rhodococcus triatomae]QNG20844.1 hypothetical protein G4H72_20850 [Rhodococcus triatomae]QNG23241.1 hypothetical protein G4H71_09535 [Rhodococcus triatomae]SDI08586.1 alanyl-tRNA synthetase [Rhodococcus triatomae]